MRIRPETGGIEYSMHELKIIQEEILTALEALRDRGAPGSALQVMEKLEPILGVSLRYRS